MILRDYDSERDRDAVHRIWHETGWLEKGKEERMDRWIACGPAHVAEINGEAECLVLTAPGTIHYLESELTFSCVSGVTTSRVARKQGAASRLTARAIAQDAANGALVSGLGMFEQGFYNQLGMGSGGYEHIVAFDPARLRVPRRARPPHRITKEHAEAVHASRLARRRLHGLCNITPVEFTRVEMDSATNGFGLGYFDGPNGELTHHFWADTDNVEDGPYRINWLSYQTYDQLLELLALMHNLGDQVKLMRINEPPAIQLQDFLLAPIRQRHTTRNTNFAVGIMALAYWQMRICDLPGCLAQTPLPGETVRFNLRLNDPIEKYLDENAAWRGVSGEYVVTLGQESQAKRGSDASLPTLSSSVNAFTRLWLGVRPATGLAASDDLIGPEALLKQLDRTLCLPSPSPDWDF